MVNLTLVLFSRLLFSPSVPSVSRLFPVDLATSSIFHCFFRHALCRISRCCACTAKGAQSIKNVSAAYLRKELRIATTELFLNPVLDAQGTVYMKEVKQSRLRIFHQQPEGGMVGHAVSDNRATSSTAVMALEKRHSAAVAAVPENDRSLGVVEADVSVRPCGSPGAVL
ncbi:hypothetical protein TRVL_10133 [Trypanosoma vivax]|nr:hypothetical protein TRVL_10133 [Trypanosoma vivax]